MDGPRSDGQFVAPDRRQVLAGVAAALAGCTDSPGTGDGSDGATAGETTAGDGAGGGTTAPTTDPATPDEPAGTDEPPAGGSTDSPTPTAGTTTAGDGDLDLREANVVGVTADRSGDSVRLEVTLHHDDDGEDGYANWWQVETLGGDRLGRRDLTHPHGTREFTRSATVTVPEEAGCVVVRGHDQTHGYGGRAMLVDPGAGATRVVDQGPEPREFDDADCPA